MKSLMQSWKSIGSLKLPGQLQGVNKLPLYLFLGGASLLALGAIAWQLLTKNAKSANDWQPAQQISNSADINLAIDTYIEVSPEFSLEAIAKQLTATQVGGLTVYKFNFSTTCGFAGCLYVLSDGYAQTQALQLWDEPYFKATSKPQCVLVEQRSQAYEICLK